MGGPAIRTVASPIGTIAVVAGPRGLRAVWLPGGPPPAGDLGPGGDGSGRAGPGQQGTGGRSGQSGAEHSGAQEASDMRRGSEGQGDSGNQAGSGDGPDSEDGEYRPTEAEALADEAAEQLAAYLTGRRCRFDLPLDLGRVSLFDRCVYAALRAVPYGTVVSYGELATRAGRPGAARAVGSACGRNPLPVVIPCHRVVAGNGALGGYSSGLRVKRFLLTLEAGARRR